ncbi:TolC family outer membrane protein [Dechloromonas denitrificans]|nr:TolC family outer membrane protein [Dechloromonas denitrificans]
MKTNKFAKLDVFALFFAVSFPSLAQTSLPATLKEVAQQAVLNSPEVTSKWHNYKAAEEEIGVARGGFLPRVDLTAGGGRETLQQPPLRDRNDYSRSSYLLSLNQMLFDGFATHNEVRRLDKARLVRYYELLDASENVALEAARAYLDVLRYRFLVNLAEDNYVQHKATHEQLIRRTQSGVGRRVDLEQAGSRLALAEINLTTETANLHDVTARYQRLINSQPPGTVLPPSQLGNQLPASQKAALDTLYQKNPALLAAVENIEAAERDIDVRRAAYSPKLDFRARTDNTNNYLGVDGQRNYNVAELVVSWNIFNGGSDRAREKQYIERKHLAVDLREKACRDTRQTLAIAYNDVQRLKEQSTYLATQVSLLEKTRDAYRDQFNVGQRTLLDLLDTENELLSARRNAVNADTDLSLAYLRTYAGMGTLLEVLGLQKLDARDPAANELAGSDARQFCPAEAITQVASNRETLNARAMAQLDSKPALPAAAVPPASLDGELQAQVNAWAAAWAAKNYNDYLAFYAPSFTPDGGLSREDWAQLRRSRIATRDNIGVELHDIKIRLDGPDRAFAEFRQVYQSNQYKDTTQKSLELIKVGGKWLINRESSVPCTGNTVGGCKVSR